MPILACGGCLKDLFVTDEEIIERFTGKELWLWGRNITSASLPIGQIGDNTSTSRSSPVQTISGGTNWRSVGLGGYQSAAIKTDGSLWLWGYNPSGALGNNAAGNHSSPVQTISGGNNWYSVSLGRFSSAAIKTDGSLWLWGRGTCGALGNNAATDRSSPVQTISGGTNWRSVSLGYHSAAIKTDGSLWLWGRGTCGALGDNATVNRSSPVQTVSGGTNWRSVGLGSYHSAAIKTDGSLWLWGRGTSGELGNRAATDRQSPVQTISGGTNWRSVSLGIFHSSAIKTDGSLWLWGAGSCGRLGNDDVTSRSSPVQTISGGTNWRSVSLGLQHSAAIKTDGSLWLWGTGLAGELGNNSTPRLSSPVQTVSGGTNWRSVSLGSAHSAATKIIEF